METADGEEQRPGFERGEVTLATTGLFPGGPLRAGAGTEFQPVLA